MATQVLRMPMPAPTPVWSGTLVPSDSTTSSKEFIERVIARLSKLAAQEAELDSPASSAGSESHCSTSGSSSSSASRTSESDYSTITAEDTKPHSHPSSVYTFSPSKHDPVYIPSRDKYLRTSFFLKVGDSDDYTHAVFASDIESPRFRGFLRTYNADRPFFDPRGPPEWTAEYSAVYEICNRLYAQTLSEHGQSMLYLKKVCDKGEAAKLRVLTESVIGRPSVYRYHTVRIFEEAYRYCETEFSPLKPSRPLCELPSLLTHRPGCFCPELWSERPTVI